MSFTLSLSESSDVPINEDNTFNKLCNNFTFVTTHCWDQALMMSGSEMTLVEKYSQAVLYAF